MLGYYRMVTKLGAGGIGAVYRATDTRLNRGVALARFTREVQVLARSTFEYCGHLSATRLFVLVVPSVNGRLFDVIDDDYLAAAFDRRKFQTELLFHCREE